MIICGVIGFCHGYYIDDPKRDKNWIKSDRTTRFSIVFFACLEIYHHIYDFLYVFFYPHFNGFTAGVLCSLWALSLTTVVPTKRLDNTTYFYL